MEFSVHCSTVYVHWRPFTDALQSTVLVKHEGQPFDACKLAKVKSVGRCLDKIEIAYAAEKARKPVEQAHGLFSASFF